MNYTVLVYDDERVDGYWATVGELTGCFTQGETLDEIRIAVAKHDPLAATLSVQVPQPA